jgi:hypothetical protein
VSAVCPDHLMPFNISDFGLTAEKLEGKYEKKGSHPSYPVSGWVRAVNLDSTMLGYWEYVVDKLMSEQEELDRDSQFN